MPVVAHSIQFLNSPVAVSRFFIAFSMALGLYGTSGLAQEAGAPAESAAPATAPDETAPKPVPEEGSPPAAPAANNNAMPVQAGCADVIQKQNALVRSLMNLQKPLPYPDKVATEKNRRDVNNLIRSGFKGEDAKKVASFLEYQMLRATDPSFVATPSNMQLLVGSMIDTIGQAGNQIGNPQEQLASRRAYCGEVLKVSRQLLENNFDSRMAAVVIISNLQDVKAIPGGTKAKVYEPAIATLVAILNDKEQPDALKTTVAGQLAFLMRTCDVTPQDQFRICDALEAELKRDCTEPGYQLGLLDAALEIKEARKKIGAAAPTAMKIFAATINDSSKPIEVRCRAAFGVGHGAYDSEMKLEILAWKIAQLAGQVTIEFSQNPNDQKWNDCVKNLFFSFWHMTKDQISGPNPKGLQNRDAKSTVIKSFAPHIATISLNMGMKTKLNLSDLKPLADLIKSSQPSNGQWDKNAPPISIP